jgi:hypothetical protein
MARSKVWFIVAASVAWIVAAAPHAEAQKKAASGVGRTINTTVLARVSVEDVPGHELVQSVGLDELSTPDPIDGVSFAGAQMKTHTQSDVVNGSGLVRGYGVWQAKSGEKVYVLFGYTIPPFATNQSTIPFEGTWEWLGGTGSLEKMRGKGTILGKITRQGQANYTWSGTYAGPSSGPED